MSNYPYFDPFRKNHVALVQFLEKELMDDKNDISMYKFGNRTQHIFKGGKYLMTIDWSKI